MASPATLVTLGNLRDRNTLSIFGLLATVALLAWGVRAAMLLGILATTAVAAIFGLAPLSADVYRISDIALTAGKLNVRAAWSIGLVEVVFVFLFVDFFDNLGTLVGVGKKAGLFDKFNRIPRIRRVLLADSIATIAGSLTGTSTVVAAPTSRARPALSRGGTQRRHRHRYRPPVCPRAVRRALARGPCRTRRQPPALSRGFGSMMMSQVSEIRWSDPAIAIPAFLTMITIPLTFSIANGLAFGFTGYALLRIVKGEFRRTHWLVYLLAALFIARFFYLGG